MTNKKKNSNEKELSSKTSLKKRIEIFSEFPYKEFPFSQRSWGHRLHSLCSYQSKLKASMGYYLVKCFSKPGDRILDPFSGVGTIPFEACLNGRRGYGVDINPVAYNTTLAKVQIPKKENVIKNIKKLEKYLDKNSSKEKVDDYTIRFYHKKTLEEILISKKFFLKNSKKKDPSISFLLSCMLHILHGNRPYALSRRSHNLTPLKPTGPTIYKSVFTSLVNKVNLSYKDEIGKSYTTGDVKMGSVLHIQYRKEFFDSILTMTPIFPIFFFNAVCTYEKFMYLLLSKKLHLFSVKIR